MTACTGDPNPPRSAPGRMAVARTPGNEPSSLRNAPAISCAERSRSFHGLSTMMTRAVVTSPPPPQPPGTRSVTRWISPNSICLLTIASSLRPYSAVYSKLEPSGACSVMKIRPTSALGANSSGIARKVNTPSKLKPNTELTINRGRRLSCRRRRS